MKVPTTERDNGAACTSCVDADRKSRHAAVENVTYRGKLFGRAPKSMPFTKIGLVAFLFLCLVILSSIEVVESRRLSKKHKAPGENDITVAETTARGSRRRVKKKKILKTSEEAKLITEKQILKKDWCHIRPLKQIVRTRNGCEGAFINNFCYGQCNSFYIPRDLLGDDLQQETFKSCSFCKPYRLQRVSVTLKCPGRRRRRKIMVNKVTECRCIAVPDIDSRTPTPEVSNSPPPKSGEISPKEPRL